MQSIEIDNDIHTNRASDKTLATTTWELSAGHFIRVSLLLGLGIY